MTERDALVTYLQQNFAKDVTDYRHNKNHVSMTVTALYGLRDVAARRGDDAAVSAADVCIAHYTNVFVPKLEAVETGLGLPHDDSEECRSPDDLPRFRNRYDRTAQVIRFFEAELHRLGGSIEALLVAWLPRLAASIGAAAFHALLRIAFGITAGYAPDVAAGLAMAVTFHAPAPSAAVDSACVADVGPSLATVQRDASLAALDVMSAPLGILGRIARYFEEDAFVSALPRLDGAQPHAVIATMRTAVLAAFEEYRDFTALHALTGTCALRVVLEQVEGKLSDEETSLVLSSFWAAVMGAVLTLPHAVRRREAAQEQASVPVDTPAAGDVAVDAVALHALVAGKDAWSSSNFEHVAKLAFACILEATVAPDLAQRYAAAAAANSVAPAPFF